MLQQRLDNKVYALFCGRVVDQKVTQYIKRHIDKKRLKKHTQIEKQKHTNE